MQGASFTSAREESRCPRQVAFLDWAGREVARDQVAHEPFRRIEVNAVLGEFGVAVRRLKATLLCFLHYSQPDSAP